MLEGVPMHPVLGLFIPSLKLKEIVTMNNITLMETLENRNSLAL